MEKETYFENLKKIVSSVEKAQKLAEMIGVKNLSQPGIIKEIITAEKLKHRVNSAKHDHDAEDFDDENIKYEYLSCLKGKSFQFDRTDESNLKKKVLHRNKSVYCSVFDKTDTLNLLKIYEVQPKALYEILLLKCRNNSPKTRHVGITEKEMLALVEKKKAKLVFKNK